MFEKSIDTDNKNIDTHIGRILAAYFLGDTENKNRFIAKNKTAIPGNINRHDNVKNINKNR
jgi:hypothetical protein